MGEGARSPKVRLRGHGVGDGREVHTFDEARSSRGPGPVLMSTGPSALAVAARQRSTRASESSGSLSCAVSAFAGSVADFPYDSHPVLGPDRFSSMTRQLDRGDRERIRRDVCLVVEGMLCGNDLEPLWSACESRLDQGVRQFAEAGRIADTLERVSFGERHARIAPRVSRCVPAHPDIILSVVDDMAPDAKVFAHPAAFDLLRHPAILDVVEGILGPEIVSDPTGACA